MPLIDWYHLAANALWVLALAIGLSALGFAFWEAEGNFGRWRDRLQQRPYAVGFNAVGILLCLGVGLSVTRLWEQAAWGVLGVLCLLNGVIAIKNVR
ncbi:MAG: hypothetical protein Fur0018_01250 [Anaerolineales bacterium]